MFSYKKTDNMQKLLKEKISQKDIAEASKPIEAATTVKVQPKNELSSLVDAVTFLFTCILSVRLSESRIQPCFKRKEKESSIKYYK